MNQSVRTLNFARVAVRHDDPAEPHAVHAIVETPRGNRNKYAYEPKFGLIALRQTLADGLEWPCDFGFIPQTLADDGDQLDVCLVLDVTTFPTCMVNARVLGAIGLEKNGERNDRVVACSIGMPGTRLSTDGARTLDDIRERVDAIERFLIEYPEQEGAQIRTTRRYDADETLAFIAAAHKRWKKAPKKKR